MELENVDMELEEAQAVGLTPTEEQGLAQNQALRRTLGIPEGADTPRKGEAQDPGEEEVQGQEEFPGARLWHTFAFEVAQKRDCASARDT